MTLAPHRARINASAQKSFRPSEALQFLDLLGIDHGQAWFRCIAWPSRQCNRSRKGVDLHGFDAEALQADLNDGQAVYAVIGSATRATGPKGGVTDADVSSLPALWVEWDNKPIAEQKTAWQDLGLPEPSLMVATGGKSVHCYWVLEAALQPEEWRPVQERLIAHCKSDTTCDNPSRVMRLPGCPYIDKKTGKLTGRRCEVIASTGTNYSLEAILAALPAEVPPPAPAPAPAMVQRPLAPAGKPPRQGKLPPRSIAEVEAAAQHIPRRVAGEGTYPADRNALCGLAAALAEAGHPNPEEHALTLLGNRWPSERDARQVLVSTTTRQSSSFWAIAQEHGFDLKRKAITKVIPSSRGSHARVEGGLLANFAVLIHSLPDGWQRNGDGHLQKTALSVGELAHQIPRDQIRFNELELMAEVHTTAGWQVIRQQDMESAYVLLDQKGWKISAESTIRAIVHVAHQNRHHPIRDYLLSLEKRTDLQPFPLDEVAPRFLRADSELHRAMVRKWLVGAVARALKPGCKMDYCLTLKGRQGILKSGFFEALASREWHSSTAPDQDKDFLLNVHACWLFELAELESHTSKRDAGRLKNLLSTARDRFRPPYGRSPEPFDRQSIFCATVNADEFFRDDTGNRRFWVIPVDGAEKIDTAAVKAARDGIWLAAIHAYRSGELPMLPDHLAEESEVQNVHYREMDPWEAPLIQWLETGPDRFTTAEALTQAGLKAKDQLTRGDENRAAVILRQLGYSKGSQQREAGRVVRKWRQGVSQPSQRVTTPPGRGCDTPEALQQKGSQPLSQPSQPFLGKKDGDLFEEEQGVQEVPQETTPSLSREKGCDGCDTRQKPLRSIAATGSEVSQPPVTTPRQIERGCDGGCDTPLLPNPLPSTNTEWVELALDCLHIPPAPQYLEAVMGWLASVPQAPAIARTAAGDALARPEGAGRMIQVQVRSASGRWCDGFELVRFNPDGTATIRSSRTGSSRNLSGWQWRDPAELAALGGAPCATRG